jgi:hypothetical protein
MVTNFLIFNNTEVNSINDYLHTLISIYLLLLAPIYIMTQATRKILSNLDQIQFFDLILSCRSPSIEPSQDEDLEAGVRVSSPRQGL